VSVTRRLLTQKDMKFIYTPSWIRIHGPRVLSGLKIDWLPLFNDPKHLQVENTK